MRDPDTHRAGLHVFERRSLGRRKLVPPALASLILALLTVAAAASGLPPAATRAPASAAAYGPPPAVASDPAPTAAASRASTAAVSPVPTAASGPVPTTVSGVVPIVAGADWPQWRGPARDGRSTSTGLLNEWPDDGPPVVWRHDGLGSGLSSVAVAGGRIYTLGDIDGEQWAIALSEDDGRELWRTPVGPPWGEDHNGPRSTPTVDGDRVYVLGTEADLVCLDAATGEVRWRRNLDDDFGGFMAAGQNVHWGRAESPLVDGDRVVVSPGARDAMVVALDRLTGEEIWRAGVPRLGPLGADGAAYSSVVVSEAAGVRQYVQLNGRGAFGVEADTGRYLWGYNRIANDVANIATPVVDGDRVIVSTGYGTGAAMLQIVPDGEGGVIAEEVWFRPGNVLQNHHGGLVLVDGVLYTGTGHNQGFPVAVRAADGEVLWGPERNEGRGSAAISYADGSLYLRYQNGLMVLADASPEGYRQRGVFPIPDRASFSWAHPVIANGRLYLREQDHLMAYDVSSAGPPPATASR